MKPAASQISSTLAASTLCSAKTVRAAAISRSRVCARRAVIVGSVVASVLTLRPFLASSRWFGSIQYCIGYKSVSNSSGGRSYRVSSYLYALGRAAYRRRVRVLLIWLAVLVVALAGAGALGGKFDEAFTVPGTESQAALDSLNRTFPQAGGVTAQVVVVVPEGSSVRDAENKQQINDATDGVREDR